MKCPYNNFNECLVEKCPACIYETQTKEIIEGRYPCWMGLEQALEEGYCWRSTETHYKFISCSLCDKGVQPVPANKQVINNSTSVGIAMIKKSIF